MKCMNPSPWCILKCFPCFFNILFPRPGKTAYNRSFYFIPDGPDCLKITGGTIGEPRLDNVNTEFCELSCKSYFFRNIHRCTGCLFTVTERSVKYLDYPHSE